GVEHCEREVFFSHLPHLPNKSLIHAIWSGGHTPTCPCTPTQEVGREKRTPLRGMRCRPPGVNAGPAIVVVPLGLAFWSVSYGLAHRPGIVLGIIATTARRGDGRRYSLRAAWHIPGASTLHHQLTNHAAHGMLARA